MLWSSNNILPVEELPERVAVGFHSYGQHQGYAINPFASGTTADNTWGYCNILDAKSYGLYSGNYAQPMSLMPVYKVVHVWIRIS